MKLYQKRSGKLARLTYLITLPLCAGMLCASTIAFSKNYGLLKLKLGHPSNSEIASAPPADDKQTEKKQRLKITNGSMTIITDELVIRGKNDKPVTFTATVLTAENKRMLASLGMIVETINAPATIKSLALPPPPPTSLRNSGKPFKPQTQHPILPPPSSLLYRSAKANIIEILLENQPDTITKSLFTEIFKRVGRTTRYPTIAMVNGTTGMVVATFRVTQDKKVGDVKIKKGISPELDAETARSISAFDGTLDVSPGTYSIGVDFNIDHGNGFKTKNRIAELEMPTAGIVTIVGYDDKKR